MKLDLFMPLSGRLYRGAINLALSPEAEAEIAATGRCTVEAENCGLTFALEARPAQ